MVHHTESQDPLSGLTTASTGGNVETTIYGTSVINTIDFSAVSYRIPLTITSSNTVYTASDTIQLSYSYPESLATKYKHKAIDTISCHDLPDIDKLVFTTLYLLDEANGQLFFNFPSWELSTKGGVHRISLDADEILRNGEFKYLKTLISSGQFRFVVLVRRPNLSFCDKAVGNSLTGESIDGGFIKDVATSSLFGVGYSEPFILQ
jgi:hypothetical protein